MQACDVPMQKLRVTRTGNTVEGHPYLRLLRAYLEEFLPRDHAQGASPIPAAGAAHTDALPRSAQSAAAARPLQKVYIRLFILSVNFACAAGLGRQASGISRQMSLRVAPSTQLHGQAAQVGLILPMVIMKDPMQDNGKSTWMEAV